MDLDKKRFKKERFCEQESSGQEEILDREIVLSARVDLDKEILLRDSSSVSKS